MLSAQSEAQLPLPVTLASASADNKADAARHTVLAQQPHPLHPLLATKLHVPRPRRQLVPRAHLVERLQRGAERALTLVSAPAGFGKTTLLAQWFAQSSTPVAWLSLEAEDNDPTRFLAYLIAALQTLDAQIGATALALLHTPQPRLQRPCWPCWQMISWAVMRAMLSSCWMTTTPSPPTPFSVG